MPEEITDAPLTELEQDQLDTGWFYFLASPDVYPELSGYVDDSRGFPILGEKASTLRGLPLAEDLLTTTDGSNRLMLQLATWRVNLADLDALAPFIDAGDVAIVTESEWLSLKPEDSEEL